MRLLREPITKTVSILLSFIMITGLFTIIAPSGYAQAADTLIKGTFTMRTFDGFDPGEQTYYYSDSYFVSSGKESNEHLRTMSAALIFQISGTSDTPEQTFGATLSNIGFKDITTYDMEYTSLDTIGTVLAHKSIDGKEVVAVALRGDMYEHEMAANMISGTEGDVKTFADAEALVENRVSVYLAEYGIASAKYWVMGYSRSGAVANLFGRELNADPERFLTCADDIFVYTVEAANGSADDTVFENIHNIVDRRDIITYVYPNNWSLYSNGIVEYIGTTDDTVMLKSFDMFSESHMTDHHEVNLAEYLDGSISFLSQNIDRETFAEEIGLPLSRVLNIFFDLDETQRSEALLFFRQAISSMMQDNMMPPTVISALMEPGSQKRADDLYALIVKHLDKTVEKNGKPVSDENYEIIKASLRTMLAPLLPLIQKDLFATIDQGNGKEPKIVPLYHMLTLVGNIEYIIKYHFNYNVFNELKAMDSYYDERKDSIIRGDADGDGSVTILDATMIQRKLADLPVLSFNEYAADVDGNGLDIIDATKIQRKLAGLFDPCNIGETVSYNTRLD